MQSACPAPAVAASCQAVGASCILPTATLDVTTLDQCPAEKHTILKLPLPSVLCSSPLSQGFLSVNLQHPGIRVQNIDPPVLTVDNFLPPETCDALSHAAKTSGRMKQSGIGGTGDLKEDIRTSNTLPITKEVLQDCPDIKQPLQQLLDTAVQLLGSQLDKSAIQSMQFVKPSGPTQLAPELPQVAHYLPGQQKPCGFDTDIWCHPC